MDLSLALTAGLMGLAGGPHCVAMCGAVCAALGQRPQPGVAPAAQRVMALSVVAVPVSGSAAAQPLPPAAGRPVAPWLFQLGRLVSYAALGAVAASSVQAVGWLSVHAAALRPLWSLMHVAAALLGLALLWQGRQPAWLERAAQRLWRSLQAALARRGASALRGAPLVLGLSWGLMPCGLLYSALLVAALSAGPWEGAGVMLLFALGSSVSLVAGPWLWRRFGSAGSGAWAVRLAGAALLALSVWALWAGLVHGTAPWCATPGA